ncbi:MAG: molybdopterin molybdotransferase MoeA [Kofleriaceae bacterium]
MLSVADATQRVIDRVPRLSAELVPLDASIGRILATDIVAARALPGFDNSAMDGYAVRSSEVPASLPVVGEVAAGAVRTEPVPLRSCVRIFTGAPLPGDLDTVVMQEDVTVDNGIVMFPAARRGDNVRRTGEDVAIGEVVLAAGTRITPWHIGLLAALGVAHVPVSRRPRVAIIATGDELVPVDVAPGAGQLVASSTHALLALIAECGGEGVALGIAPDDVEATRAMIARALGDTSNARGSSSHTGATHASGSPPHASTSSAHVGSSMLSSPTSTSTASTSEFDAVITTGGVSVGDRDHVHTALAAAGVTRELYKVAMKPGKPFAFGMYSRRDTTLTTGGSPVVDTPVFGLPGNPVSTVVAFELFVRPALLAMQRASMVERPRVCVQLAEAYRKQAGRAHFLRAWIAQDGDRMVAHAHPKQGSAMLSSLVGTTALVEIPAEATEVATGGIVRALLVGV